MVKDIRCAKIQNSFRIPSFRMNQTGLNLIQLQVKWYVLFLYFLY